MIIMTINDVAMICYSCYCVIQSCLVNRDIITSCYLIIIVIDGM